MPSARSNLAEVLADLGRAFAALGVRWYHFEARLPDPVAFAETSRVLPVVHRPTRMPADVVLAGPGLEERFLACAEARVIEGVVVPVASAPDLIVMKVLAGRPQDLEDAVAVLRAQGDGIDVARARAALGELERALDRRDLVPALERALALARRP